MRRDCIIDSGRLRRCVGHACAHGSADEAVFDCSTKAKQQTSIFWKESHRPAVVGAAIVNC